MAPIAAADVNCESATPARSLTHICELDFYITASGGRPSVRSHYTAYACYFIVDLHRDQDAEARNAEPLRCMKYILCSGMDVWCKKAKLCRDEMLDVVCKIVKGGCQSPVGLTIRLCIRTSTHEHSDSEQLERSTTVFVVSMFCETGKKIPSNIGCVPDKKKATLGGNGALPFRSKPSVHLRRWTWGVRSHIVVR